MAFLTNSGTGEGRLRRNKRGPAEPPSPPDPTETSDLRWFVDEVLAEVQRRRDVRAAGEIAWKTLSAFKRSYLTGGRTAEIGWLARATLASRRSRLMPIRPAPDFDEQAYLGRYADVWRAVQAGKLSSGFAHYVVYGRKEDRIRFRRQAARPTAPQRAAFARPRRKTEAGAILTMLADEARGLPVLETFVDVEARLLLVYHAILRKYSLFDDEFYAATYLASDPGDDFAPLEHYLAVGSRMGHWPNRFFDPVEYETLNPQIEAHGMDPVIHYALFGWRQGCLAGSHFDGARYLDYYPDVRDAGICPLQHFLATGYRQARQAIPTGAALPIPRPDMGGMEMCRFGARNCGTIILVTHDTNVGGAQHIANMLASWLLASTKYAVKIVSMRQGTRAADFEKIAPVFDIESNARRYDRETVMQMLQGFAGPDVRGILINSVASGGFFDYWDRTTPAIAYIHELPRVIERFGPNIEKIKARTKRILAGSPPVRDALVASFGVSGALCEVVWDFIEELPADEPGKSGREKARQGLGLGPDEFVVMACGVVHARKGPERFIEVAERVAAALDGACRFVWVGGGPDEARCRALIEQKQLGKVVEILGFRTKVHDLFKAADVFLLPSGEDPFPLVCLYAAAARVPIVCFAEAGGTPDFVERGCGIAVPFLDVQAMADAVLDYRSDPATRAEHGAAGERLVRSEFTLRNAGPLLLDHLREAIGARPYVSVIVPNYNYAQFLGERIRSICEQTFRDIELILLDDASTDNSVEILQHWAERVPGARLVVNGENTGSPFAQWLKGMALARSDLIWLAEADDACSPSLLESLLPAFDDRNVFLGHVKSVPVNEGGQIAGDHEKNYLDRIDAGRWTQAYTDSDHREMNASLGIANCIPNASAVIVRRFEPEPDFAGRISTMRMCGDWYFYQRAMRGGQVAYSANAANFHRRHERTLTIATQGSPRYFDELAAVRSAISETYRLFSDARVRADQFLEEDLERFSLEGAERDRVRSAMNLAVSHRKLKPSLLIVTSDLSPGGGQMFNVRLANAWMRSGGRAFLLNARRLPDHPKVMAKLDSRVALWHADVPDFSLGQFIRDWDIDIVHSSLWWADKLIHQNVEAIPAGVPWLVTMHGCYETHLQDSSIDPSFPWRMQHMLARVDQWVYTADKNLQVFDAFGFPKRLAKLQNGYQPEPARPVSRASLGLRPDSFVLCLASRAIASKGWRTAVEAVERLNAGGRNVELMLIGEGPEADRLRQGGLPPGVHLFGQTDNLQDYIAASDVGLLPSTFVGESMPLVLLEFMAQGKPVVATDVGEIPNMIETETGPAGVVVRLAGAGIPVDALAAAIEELLDPAVLRAAGHIALEQFSKRFAMSTMLGGYADLYGQLLGDLRTAP